MRLMGRLGSYVVLVDLTIATLPILAVKGPNRDTWRDDHPLVTPKRDSLPEGK